MTKARAKQGMERLPDLGQRERIVTELDKNMLVEAAAGTGKTTCMVQRMLALLRTGKCGEIRNLVAITFTRKAAGEIRSRFQVELERETREASGAERKNLERALDGIEHCFIGTIHSFCARLLRERPVEAGLDLNFREMDDLEDRLLREEAWEEFISRITSHDPDDITGELGRVGLSPFDLKPVFMDFVDFPDVDEWPLPDDVDLEAACERARKNLEAYLEHVLELLPRLPAESGTDELIPELKRLPRVVSHYNLEDPVELMEVLERFESDPKVTKKMWENGSALTKEDAERESERWSRFREDTVRPALEAWREARYAVAMRALSRAGEVYERLRMERGCLNFQDLLMSAARLLRENPHVRRYFQSRYTHLMVDEFQDTDPVQAEVIFLLASSDVDQVDWRRCTPRPGSLFLVGDPKQSIYRFRRADITTYNEAKKLVLDTGGSLVHLSANFRSRPALIDWVNRVFEPREEADAGTGTEARFPPQDTDVSPCYVPLLKGREEGDSLGLEGVYRIPVPRELSKKEQIIPYEADLIARFIRHALDEGMAIPRSRREMERGVPPQARPSDFMIITYNKGGLDIFAQKLREYGVPHRVSGGAALKDNEELRLLYLYLKAALYPDDPVALVAVLRSELFGISDAALYSFKKHGGVFSFYAPVPEGMPAEEAEAFRDAFRRLRRGRESIFRMPPMAAVESTVDELGLAALAASRPGGDLRAGGFLKGVELLRETRGWGWSSAQLLDTLGLMLEGKVEHDGMTARSEDPPAVRVLNLHKAKGLEAPVVFLADVTGKQSRPYVQRHVDRSGDKVRGYLALYRDQESYSKKILAHPREWDDISRRELVFQEAEELRLRYVAATRAGTACVVSTRETFRNRNPWAAFQDLVADGPALEAPARTVHDTEEGERIGRQEVRYAVEELQGSLAALRKETHRVLAAREYALAEAERLTGRRTWEIVERGSPGRSSRRHGPGADLDNVPGDDGGSEQGMAWGEVIHLLLQVAMERPRADLLPLARSALRGKDMDPSLAEEAVLVAGAITASPLWQRALRSGCRLVEIPFHVPLDDGCDVPTVVRGVVDLAFREDGGWVLVDYKTGGRGSSKSRGLEPDYEAQILLYARAWERCTGEGVKEALVYLVEEGLLYRVS
ncbi:MAG: UvrD-helicase domain-containing protein [Actinobacteria bacterium]|nr:UvrD-helicase domain-containing protein [Actinomycetota bacterium]